MPYKQLEHTADRMFEVTGKDLETIFKDAAKALINIIANPKTIKPKIKKELSIKGTSDEKVLYNLLEEIIFIKDTESLIFKKTEKLNYKDKELKITLVGDKINPKTQELGNDVKAVTMHKFKLKKLLKDYKATIIIDI